MAVDTRLINSYKSDRLARSLKTLATSFAGSTLYIDRCGYIVCEDRVYTPFSEAERVFKVLYDDNPGANYEELVSRFENLFYSAKVESEHMRRWFRTRVRAGLEVDTAWDDIYRNVATLPSEGSSEYILDSEWESTPSETLVSTSNNTRWEETGEFDACGAVKRLAMGT